MMTITAEATASETPTMVFTIADPLSTDDSRTA
jgi:hypothetical protein